MRIILATNNQGKINELKAMLAKHAINLPVVSLNDVGFIDDIIEDGHSFHQNSLIKAQAIAKLYSNDIIIADDSGLSCNGLGGEPGIYSARYAGDLDCNDFLLDKLIDVEDRTAYFSCVITVIAPNHEPIFCSGYVHGIILSKKLGEQGFGYDKVFSVDGRTSFAQLAPNEKALVSHRFLAFEKLMKLALWSQYV